MPSCIDHVVIVVRNLALASAAYTGAGFTVTPGGEHTGGATHNALIAFGDGAYLELIAFREPDLPQPHRWWPRLNRAEGLVDYAMLSSDLTSETTAIQRRGWAVPPPVDGGRERPDGRRIAWRSVMLQERVGESALPFLIEDVTEPALRVPGGAARAHQLGVQGIAGLTCLVTNLSESRMSMERLLGAKGAPVEAGIDGVERAVRFDVGPHWLVLAEAASPELGARVADLGAGPFELTLRGHAPAAPGSGELLDVASLHHARIWVGP